MSDFFRDLDRVESRPATADRGPVLRDRHLALLTEFARELSGVGDVHELGRLLVRRLLCLTSADRALLFLAQREGAVRFVLGVDRGGVAIVPDGDGASQDIVGRVLSAGEPLLVSGVGRTGKDPGGVSAASTICVPLDGHRGRVGAVLLDRIFGEDDLDDDDLLVTRLVAVQASQAIELLRLEEERREAIKVSLENEHLRRLSRRTADEARVIEDLNRELKGRTEKLTAATAFLSGILESSTEYAIVATDLDGNVNTWNAGAVRIYGFPAAEIVGRSRLDVLFEESDRDGSLFDEMTAAIRGEAGRFEGEVKRVRKDGAIISIHAAATAIRDEDGRLVGYLDVSRDITRECEMRRQMLLAEKMAALGTLAAGVAHEFNNLLQGIVGFLEHAQQGGDLATKDKAMAVALSGARRAADLTRQLQSIARPTISRPAPVELRELVGEALALVEKSFASEGVELVARHESAPPAFVDRSRIQQVLLNLITNARHAVQKAARKSVAVRTYEEDSWCVLEVEDTGCGMSPEVQRRIFEPFFTTKGALGGTVYDGKIHGTGLGLAISQGIVSESQGRIELTSAVGKGTRFRVLLPKSGETVRAAPPQPAGLAPGSRADVPLRVLVVDDEAPIRDLLRAVLGARGHAVTCVPDGGEGVDAFRQAPFDVVVADYQMPRQNGAELLAAVARLAGGRAVRRILVTGLPPSEVEIPAGLDRLLEKPYSVSEIVAAVEGRRAPATADLSPSA